MNNFKLAPVFSGNGPLQNGYNNVLKEVISRTKHILNFSNDSDMSSFSSGNNMQSNRKWKGAMKKSLLPVIIIGVFVVFGIFMIGNALRNSSNSPTQTTGGQNTQVDIEKPKAQETLNKDFTFSIKDATGAEVSKLKFTIQNVEKRDQIVVKGQRASSIKGRTFLIINMKITNSFQKPVQINSRDYVRLMVNNSDEKLAPDIHNDPVEIQAISTKYTRVGFPINDSDTNLTLQVGEISGKKESIKLNLK